MGLINFFSPEKEGGGLLERRGLFERGGGGGLIENFQKVG